MMTINQSPTELTWVSPPSETILRLIYQKEFNLHLFRLKIGLSIDQFIDVLHDKIEMTVKFASQLSEILGGSQGFWLRRYEEFNEYLNESNKVVLSDNFEFLESLSKARSTSIDDLLDDFKISTYENLIIDYLKSPKILYSKSQRMEPSPVNIANWVRKCEFVAERVILKEPVHIFSPTVLDNSLGELLSLTKVNSVNNIIHKLKAILLKSGIVLVLSPSVSGNQVSGFTKKLLKKYRLVVVTDRYKNNAAFWFTLLHELAHCILHSINQPIIHYSDHEFVLASLETNDIFEEEEANDFVEKLLFPPDFMNEIKKSNKSYRSIMKLGVKYDISTALIVAQIHRMKISPYHFFRKVYRSIKFDSIF